MLAKRLNRAYFKHRVLSEFERMQSVLARLGLYTNANQKSLVDLKGKFAGKTAMIVGNGPSLSMADLTRVKEAGLISIASNRIYLAFDKTDWCPDFLTFADELVISQSIDALKAQSLTRIFPSRFQNWLETGSGVQRGKNIGFRALNTSERDSKKYSPQISDNAIKGFFVGQTVTVLNIQLAHWLGCKKVFLIGMDGKYDISNKRVGHDTYGEVAVSAGEKNHYHADYRKPGETWSVPRPDLHEIEFAACRKFLEKRGVPIVNLSRSTMIEAFETGDFDAEIH